jgi:hypothetical protein
MLGKDQLRLSWRAVEEAICGAADILPVRASIARLPAGAGGPSADGIDKAGDDGARRASGGATSFNVKVFPVV